LFLYPLGWIAAIARFFKLFSGEQAKAFTRADRFLLWVIYLVPVGKLVYFNVPGLMGFKFSFLIWSVACLVAFGSWIALKRFSSQRLLVFLIFLFFPVMSLILRGDYGDLLYYSADGQNDSLGARIASLIFLMMFAVAVYDLCRRQGYEVVVRAFVDGVIMAAVIGCVIFVLVYAGFIGVAELEPISADTHIVGLVYRFNPGGNVNEFGLISIYALMLVRMAYPSIAGAKQHAVYGLLLFALFFSLTRAAWLAYAGALAAMAVVSGRGRKALIIAVSSFAVFVFIVYQLNDEFANIVATRFAFEGGASGDERLDKVADAFLSNSVPTWEIIFGHGWATNLYLHSVPLQLIYETGLAGYLLTSSAMAWAVIKLIMRSRRDVPGALALLGCLTAFSIDSVLHHTLYNMQTWVIAGLTLYIAFAPWQTVEARKSDSFPLPEPPLPEPPVAGSLPPVTSL
jgi:hypothetical protein